jgi:hypothetical protein
MLENITFLTGRRSHEFSADGLRLSTLSIKPIQEAIQELFQFQSFAIGTPISTFGEVPLTFPPGVVFNTGVWKSPENKYVAIRFFHFEAQRIVIDVAGSSAALTPIFDQLYRVLSQIETLDGSPLVGKPQAVLDYSEISATFPFSLEVLIPQPIREALAGVTKGPVLLPTLIVQSASGEQVLAGTAVHGDNHAFTFAPRAGSRPEDHIYFSGAPLDSETHLEYLKNLEASLRS